MKRLLQNISALCVFMSIVTGCSEKTQNAVEPNPDPQGDQREVHSVSVLPTTTIEFNVPEPAIVTLKIYDGIGNETAVLLDHVSMDDGVNEVEFDAGRLPTGVYFYVVNMVGVESGATYVERRRMMLIK